MLMLVFYYLYHTFAVMKKVAAIFFTLLYFSFTVAAGSAWALEGYGCDIHYNEGSKDTQAENGLAGTHCEDETHSSSLLLHQALKHHLSAGKVKPPRLGVFNLASQNQVAGAGTVEGYLPLASRTPFSHSTPIFLRNRVLRI